MTENILEVQYNYVMYRNAKINDCFVIHYNSSSAFHMKRRCSGNLCYLQALKMQHLNTAIKLPSGVLNQLGLLAKKRVVCCSITIVRQHSIFTPHWILLLKQSKESRQEIILKTLFRLINCEYTADITETQAKIKYYLHFSVQLYNNALVHSNLIN